MKNNQAMTAFIVIILIFGATAYVGRHQLKQILMGGTPPKTSAPVTSTGATGTTTSITTARTDANKGSYLAAANSMTLYTFDKDGPNVSNCTGGCATLWPAYVVTGTPPATMPTNITTFQRPDGSMQYAWMNKPLYFYQPDKQPGDLLGDGVGGVWHIVKL